MKLTPEELRALLVKEAMRDVRAAKKHGSILICQTRIGTAELSVHYMGFQVRQHGEGPLGILFTGGAFAMAGYLADHLLVVEVVDE
jgi:hypothetical protein